MNWEKQKETMRLTSIYQKKVLAWKERKSSAKVVKTIGGNGAYNYVEDSIRISYDAVESKTMFHELGHELYHKFKPQLKTAELFRYIFSMTGPAPSVNESKEFLDLLAEEYGLNKSDITPVSDFCSMICDSLIGSYYGHKTGYVMSHSSNIREDELFANIVAVIGAYEWRAIYCLQEICPNILNQVLDVLDRCMHVENKEEEMERIF